MKQVRPVMGENLIEFADAMNEAYCELSRFKVEETRYITDLSALISYEIPDELMDGPEDQTGSGPEPDYTVEFDDAELDDQTVTIQLKVGENANRHCCECENYDWGRGCPYRRGHIRIMDPACSMFNIIIERR